MGRATQLPGEGRRHPLAGPVRLGRRRWRSHPRDHGTGPQAGRSGGLAEGRRRAPRRSSPGAPRGVPRPPVWVGELYLELHRGTYTSAGPHQAGQPQKRTPAREAELWATTAALHVPEYAYPYERPTGCGDGPVPPVPRHPAGIVDRLVHREAEAEYARGGGGRGSDGRGARGTRRGRPRVFNTSPVERREVVRTADGSLAHTVVPANGCAPLESVSAPDW
ncbi:hypothetical protein LV779_36675 [Streptomyces thinghirensis]|nr:hypothetical protein [Streptomyces thinghirensis]